MGTFLWTRDDENRTLMIERFRRKVLIANEEPEETTIFFDPSLVSTPLLDYKNIYFRTNHILDHKRNQ